MNENETDIESQIDSLFELINKMRDTIAKNTISFEIPAQTRSVYIDYLIPNEFSLVRHKLNLPKFLVKQEFIGMFKRWTIKAVNENGEMCYVPFTNIVDNNIICLGNIEPANEKQFVDAFFNTKFTMTGPYHICHYFKKEDKELVEITTEIIRDFYKNWEKTGKLQLVKM